MNSYKELHVWQKSVGLVIMVYEYTRSFPKEELYVLTSQIRRAAISIPSNIAEGYNRKTTKEYIQFVQISFGSAAELETQLVIASKLGYLSEENYTKIDSHLQEILKMLNGLLVKLKAKNNR